MDKTSLIALSAAGIIGLSGVGFGAYQAGARQAGNPIAKNDGATITQGNVTGKAILAGSRMVGFTTSSIRTCSINPNGETHDALPS